MLDTNCCCHVFFLIDWFTGCQDHGLCSNEWLAGRGWHRRLLFVPGTPALWFCVSLVWLPRRAGRDLFIPKHQVDPAHLPQQTFVCQQTRHGEWQRGPLTGISGRDKRAMCYRNFLPPDDCVVCAFLLSYLQFSKDALTGHYPVNTIDFAIQISTLMAQVRKSVYVLAHVVFMLQFSVLS